MFSYQCSQLSTPKSVIEVFNTAKRFQKNQDTSKYVSVVVLDEVGLAEDSPNLPLKALHPLLEDGTEGADDSEEVYGRDLGGGCGLRIPQNLLECGSPWCVHMYNVGSGEEQESGLHRDLKLGAGPGQDESRRDGNSR